MEHQLLWWLFVGRNHQKMLHNLVNNLPVDLRTRVDFVKKLPVDPRRNFNDDDNPALNFAR
eukprot:8272941-Lingulodinium_polyedra.AAC.1